MAAKEETPATRGYVPGRGPLALRCGNKPHRRAEAVTSFEAGSGRAARAVEITAEAGRPQPPPHDYGPARASPFPKIRFNLCEALTGRAFEPLSCRLFKASERKLATDDREQPQWDRNQAYSPDRRHAPPKIADDCIR